MDNLDTNERGYFILSFIMVDVCNLKWNLGGYFALSIIML